jgi:hypothetical protein
LRQGSHDPEADYLAGKGGPDETRRTPQRPEGQRDEPL